MKDGLIFWWPARHHLPLLLPAALVLAFALHAGLFFLFSIIYPRQETAAVDAAKVYFPPAGTPESAMLSALMESGDPAVFAPGRGLPARDFGGGRYVARYASERPVLDGLPEVPRPPDLPAAPGPVPVFARGRIARVPVDPTARIVASGGLAGREPSDLPSAAPRPSAGSDPAPAVFLAAVRGDGSVAHLFASRGSGDADYDRQVAEFLRGVKFSESGCREAWGHVRFEWGSGR
jgi:hypothetical protein